MDIIKAIQNKEVTIGIIGLGYVGLPLMLTFTRKQFKVIGFDNDTSKVKQLNSGKSYIKHIESSEIDSVVKSKNFFATNNFSHLASCHAIIICVPTPLNRNREPDTSYIEMVAHTIASVWTDIIISHSQLVVLESTTYPGTTDTLLKPILEKSGKVLGKDFFLAFSPEREDPGNETYNTQTIPKIVGGITPACLDLAVALYSSVLDKVVPVSSSRAAEMTKLLENIYRCVNIALVNELKTVCDAMQIDIWEVIDAAATKPFGYSAFYPGPGLGGHCIPIDPFYLTWKAREYNVTTRFIELAGEINNAMPHYVLDKIIYGLNKRGKSINNSKILIIGIAYKKDVDDMRESPALPLISKLVELGATIAYHDPYIPSYKSLKSIELNESISEFDACVIVTNHSIIDYQALARMSRLIIDCRNATKSVSNQSKIIKA